ncbi:hypothetical protein ES703_111166 [subsurface metagenome]
MALPFEEVQVEDEARPADWSKGLPSGTWGGELRALEELVGRGGHLNLYQSFRDPQTSAIMGEKQYSFIVHGPVSPLSVSG